MMIHYIFFFFWCLLTVLLATGIGLSFFMDSSRFFEWFAYLIPLAFIALLYRKVIDQWQSKTPYQRDFFGFKDAPKSISVLTRTLFMVALLSLLMAFFEDTRQVLLRAGGFLLLAFFTMEIGFWSLRYREEK